MSFWKFSALLLLTGCAASPPLSAADSSVMADAGSAARGGVLVRTHCAGCHAVGLTGESPLDIAPPFRELNRRYPVQNLQEALAEGMVTAHPQMPEFVFEPRQVVDLIAYLESIGGSARIVL